MSSACQKSPAGGKSSEQGVQHLPGGDSAEQLRNGLAVQHPADVLPAEGHAPQRLHQGLHAADGQKVAAEADIRDASVGHGDAGFQAAAVPIPPAGHAELRRAAIIPLPGVVFLRFQLLHLGQLPGRQRDKHHAAAGQRVLQICLSVYS